MIDNLVVKVFVGDGYITAHIKLGNATEVADIRLEEVKKALEHIFNCVQTLSPLAQREGLCETPYLVCQFKHKTHYIAYF